MGPARQAVSPGIRRIVSVRQKWKIAVGVLGLLALVEGRSRAISRLLRVLKRSVISAIIAYVEERSGSKLFTLEDELPAAADHLSSPLSVPAAPALSSPAAPASAPAPHTTAEPQSVDQLLSSAKLFSTMDLEASRRLYERCGAVELAPRERLFAASDPSASGAFIVASGALEVFLDGTHPARIATLGFGEALGELDCLDGAPRSVNAQAGPAGCRLVQVDRDLFLRTAVEGPRMLQLYLARAIARLWRVGHFVLRDFLQLPLEAVGGVGGASGLHGGSNGGCGTSGSPYHADAVSLSIENAPLGPLTEKELTGEQALTLARAVLPQGLVLGSDGSGSGSEAPPAPKTPSVGTSSVSDGGEAAAAVQSSPYRQLRSFYLPPGLKGVLESSAADALLSESGPVGLRSPSSSPVPFFRAPASPPPAAAVSTSPSAISRLMRPLQGILRSSKPTAAGPAPPRLSSAQRRVSFSDVDPAQGAPLARQSSPTAAAALTDSPGSRPLPVVVSTHVAGLADGWDVVAPDESGLGVATLVLLSISVAPAAAGAPRPRPAAGRPVHLTPGEVLFEVETPLREFYVLIEGDLVVERPASGGRRCETALLAPGSLVGGAAFLTTTRTGCRAWAAGEGCALAAVGQAEIDALVAAAEATAAAAAVQEAEGDDACSEDSMHTAEEGESSNGRPGSAQSLGSLASMSPSPPRPASPSRGLAPPAASPWEALPPPTAVSAELHPGAVVVDLLLAAARALAPTIRQFISLGLSRVWYRAGEVVYRAGEPADALYIIISGRARLLHGGSAAAAGAGGSDTPGGVDLATIAYSGSGTDGFASNMPLKGPQTPEIRVEDDIGRGESMGAVWAVAGGTHDTTAWTVRDLEAVRMSRAAFEMLAAWRPRAAARLLQGMAERLAAAGAARRGPGRPRGGEVATIAVLPAGTPLPGSNPGEAVSRLARALRAALEADFGPAALLDLSSVEIAFPTESRALEVPFFRSKVTTWLSQKEEDCRFIVLQGDAAHPDSPWSRICADQADCVLLVAAADGAAPQVSREEDATVWAGVRRAAAAVQHAFDAKSDDLDRLSPFASASAAAGPAVSEAPSPQVAAALRRVEFVLLHPPNSTPSGTAAWLESRPLLRRHHHIALSRPASLSSLARWMAGAAVGVVLSGGGSRGLAHLGVLRALEDSGVPIDVVGGTSQGAMMAGLHAQRLGWTSMQARVRVYAAEMGSPRRLASDLTLPLLSVFTGAGLDGLARDAFSGGPQAIEDLWTPFFCVTTNLTQGSPQVHRSGELWRAVRASMTLIGLVPPVVDANGDLLCDGGYCDNIPVAAMREEVGPGGTVVVVDVEDRDSGAWRDLTPTDGGVSGWALLWDKLCPWERWRYGIKVPGHAALVNALAWMAHKQNLARLAAGGHRVDLYLRPPVTQYRLLDYHLADRIVREASRYAFAAVAEWHRSRGSGGGGEGVVSGGGIRLAAGRRSASVSCMAALQAKQVGGVGGGGGGGAAAVAEDEEEEGEGSEGLVPPQVLLTRAATAHPELAVRLNGRLAAAAVVAAPAPAAAISVPKVVPDVPKAAVLKSVAAVEANGGDMNGSSGGDDQFKFLETIEIEFEDDDLPF